MTLTKSKFVMTLSRFEYFLGATANCNISHQTLIIAFKNIESDLGLDLFDRSKTTLWVTKPEARNIQQTPCVVDEDQLNSQLYLGTIFTINPYQFLHCIFSLQKTIDILRNVIHSHNLQGITTI